ncbi:hypothetical protein [Stenotrophomonas sp. Bg11-02]|uniref:hypothetical protein n=1 Tax=Stenotrophomonas sp. Bg11-02 TaxID=2058303 RepID=UPI0012FF331C|nr:hypothetical protein [Stenotrophomonas sp. Bg11-02]
MIQAGAPYAGRPAQGRALINDVIAITEKFSAGSSRAYEIFSVKPTALAAQGMRETIADPAHALAVWVAKMLLMPCYVSMTSVWD